MDTSTRRKRYVIRPSYLYGAKHFNDVYLNLGFQYKGQLLKKGTSPELWANPLNTSIINTLDSMLYFLIEHAKHVKKWFSIAHDKNDINL